MTGFGFSVLAPNADRGEVVTLPRSRSEPWRGGSFRKSRQAEPSMISGTDEAMSTSRRNLQPYRCFTSLFALDSQENLRAPGDRTRAVTSPLRSERKFTMSLSATRRKFF